MCTLKDTKVLEVSEEEGNDIHTTSSSDEKTTIDSFLKVPAKPLTDFRSNESSLTNVITADSSVIITTTDIKMNTFDNCFKHRKKDANQHSHGVLISAHRGGQADKEPENTMHAFEKAIEQGLKSIELDIWLSSDNQLVVIHGGDNGEMPLPVAGKEQHDRAPRYIFENSFDEI